MYMTRCIFDAFKIESFQPPYDTGIARIYYPAQYSGSTNEQDTGLIPADESLAPYPVLILFHGMNTDSAGYRWLAEALAPLGIATVTYQLVSEATYGSRAVTPGIDLEALTPEKFGTAPSAQAAQPILEMLERLNSDSLLAGKLDLTRLAFGGHSAGGTLALLNANQEWFPSLRAVFTYGAHTGVSTALGWPEETLLPFPPDLPLLLMGGEQDGCIAHSARHYGDATPGATARIEQTFEKAVPQNNGNNTLLLFNEANHFAICTPADETCGRGYIDTPTISHHARESLGYVICNFLQGFLCDEQDAFEMYRALEKANRPYISQLARK
uniref:alpha/beta hydrolase n=1 Tax=Microbulbifer agarilyticus TaxID=260552 RepID=UPI000255BA92|nr:alpha/beta hydrolase [Microbulbifer agarilyticus]